MNHTPILVFLLFSSLSATAQTVYPVAYTEISAAKPAPVTYRLLPALPDDGSFTAFLSDHAVYPELAAHNGIEGTVVLILSVDADGRVVERRVVRPVHPLLDAAALKAAARLPRLLPAVQDGHAIARGVLVPVRFRLR